MDTFRIVVWSREDLMAHMDELVALYQRAYESLPEYGYHHPERIRSYILWLWCGDPQGFMVAMSGEKVVGFIGVHGTWEEEGELWGEIHEFVVHPDYQKRGIGNLLFERALLYVQERGRKKCGLWVGVKNERAFEFYRKHGFAPHGQWGKWIRMVKELVSHDPS